MEGVNNDLIPPTQATKIVKNKSKKPTSTVSQKFIVVKIKSITKSDGSVKETNKGEGYGDTMKPRGIRYVRVSLTNLSTLYPLKRI